MTIRLTKDGNSVTKYLHKLIGEQFVSNQQLKCCINHKDGNKLNNSLENLEYVTASENKLHAHQIGLIKLTVKKVLDWNTGEVYESVRQAANELGYNYSTLKNYLNGNRSNPTPLKYEEDSVKHFAPTDLWVCRKHNLFSLPVSTFDPLFIPSKISIPDQEFYLSNSLLIDFNLSDWRRDSFTA